MNRRAKPFLLCLMLILAAAGFLRFYGLRVGFPFEYHVDEWFIVNKTLEMYLTGSLKPPAFDYPSLIFNLLLAGAYVVGMFKEPSLYDLYIVGRSLSAVFGTATVGLVYLAGKRAYGERAALLAAAFFAFTVTALRESHFYTTDTVNVFFIVLAVHFIVKVALGDAPRNYLYAGTAIGLAAGSKYNGAFLVVPLVFAHLARAAGEIDLTNPTGAHLKKLGGALLSKWLIAAGALSALAFLATTPYAVITPQPFMKDLAKMSNALSEKIVEGNHHYIGTPPYLYYIENLLFWAMNPVLEAACLAGFVYALARRRRQDIVVALWVVIYFAIVGGWLNKAVRYTLPLLPFLALFGARMFVEAHDHFAGRRRQRALSIAVAALGALVLASALLYSLAFMSIYRQPHTGIQATRWAFEHVPQGLTILLEGPTPHERPQLDGEKMIRRDGSFDFDSRGFRFKYLDVPKFTHKESDAEGLRAELEATLAGVDFIVMSIRWYEGLVNSPEASPVIKNYYRSLLDGTSEFELVKELTSYPSLFGVEIRDDAAELNFRIFDHPKVWIFKRKKI